MEERHSDMVSEIQRERILQKAIPISFCDFYDLVQNITESESMAESFIRCHGRLGHLGDSERRTKADNGVHRERDHDGAVFSSSDMDIRKKDRKRLEEDTVAKR